MVPGPTSVPQHVRDAFAIDYASADLELPFFELYAHVQTRLAEFLRVPSSSASSSSLPYENDVIIQVGEGMLALWSALKSTIKAGDRVLAISNGARPPRYANLIKFCRFESIIELLFATCHQVVDEALRRPSQVCMARASRRWPNRSALTCA
jgi:aspartate aminotransferase-like enzyme